MRQKIRSGVQADFDGLRERLLRHIYPATLPVLAFYWLKTVYASGYGRADWQSLDALLRQALTSEFSAGSPRHDALQHLQSLVQRLLNGDARPRSPLPRPGVARPAPADDRLVPYVARLLNEWLPTEVAHMLVEEVDGDVPDPGIPSMATARALERLLMRERLTESTLQALLEPQLFTPRLFYPGDAEILRDVILYLLGRTHAAPSQVLPAMLLFVSPNAPLSPDYRDAVESAYLAEGSTEEELRVPIPPAQALRILSGNDVRLASLVVTMDGRSWQSGQLKSGDENAVVYHPGALLSIDYSVDHATLRVPWPESRQRWSGPVSFDKPFELFGREWRVAHWEQDGDYTWLHLVFVRMLSVAPVTADATAHVRRARPAGVDMAWTTLENALALSIAHNAPDHIEQLRHEELIPLGRALSGLAQSVLRRRTAASGDIETRLRAVAYHGSELLPTHGRIPWRILPESMRKALLERRLYAALSEPLHQAFDGLPEISATIPKSALPAVSLLRLLSRKSPSRAA